MILPSPVPFKVTNIGVMREIETTGGFPISRLRKSYQHHPSFLCSHRMECLFGIFALMCRALVGALPGATKAGSTRSTRSTPTTESCHQNPSKLQLAPATELLHHGDYISLSLSLSLSHTHDSIIFTWDRMVLKLKTEHL